MHTEISFNVLSTGRICAGRRVRCAGFRQRSFKCSHGVAETDIRFAEANLWRFRKARRAKEISQPEAEKTSKTAARPLEVSACLSFL